MDLNKATYGRASSMPLLPRDMTRELELEEDLVLGRQLEWSNALKEIEGSPDYQILLASAVESQTTRLLNKASTRTPTRILQPEDHGGSEPFSSPDSDETVKPGDGCITALHEVELSDDDTHGSDQADISNSESDNHGNFGRENSLPRRFSPSAPIFRPSANTAVNILPKSASEPLLGNNFSFENMPVPIESPDNMNGDFQNILRRYHGFPDNMDRNDVLIANTGVQVELPAWMSSKRGTARQSQIADLYLDNVTPVRDSPGPRPSIRHRRFSGRFSSFPSVPSPLGPGHFRDDLCSDTSGLVASPATAPPQHEAFGYRNGQDSPTTGSMITPKKRAASLLGNLPTYSVHVDINDLFVDSWYVALPGTPTYSPIRPRAHTPTTPSRRRSDPQRNIAPNVQGCSELPIPPPPLPVVQGLHQSDEARQRLDKQKAIREQWIREEARKIADLNRAALLAKQDFDATDTTGAWYAWQHAQTILKDAMNIEKRMEERRNLLLPPGMKALRTGPDSLVEDGFAGGANRINDKEEGKLLGFRMALMERICAEIVREDQAIEMDAGTVDERERMLMRRQAVGDLQFAMRRRNEEEKMTPVSDAPSTCVLSIGMSPSFHI